MLSLVSRIEVLVDKYPLSDVLIKKSNPIAIRVHGEIETPYKEKVSADDINNFIELFLSEQQLYYLEQYKSFDLAVELSHHRFRATLFYTSVGLMISLRKLQTEVLSMQQLKLPAVVQTVLGRKSGLVLLTGPTGAGKSTSLASLIDQINSTQAKHILTIEDPIEYIHENKKSIVTQREISRNTPSYDYVLRSAVRGNADVVVLGDMSDIETTRLALNMAETGHLVFATLDTAGIANTVSRVIHLFPFAEHRHVQQQLSQSLRMVITQKLLRRVDGEGMLAAFGVMVGNHVVKELLREGKILQIEDVVRTSKDEGMVSMEDAISALPYEVEHL